MELKYINPLNKNDHSASKNLSDFPTLLRSAFPLVPENAKICLICRRQIYKQKSNLSQTDTKKAKIVCNDEYHRAGLAVLQQIKKKFSESTNKQERIQLLHRSFGLVRT